MIRVYIAENLADAHLISNLIRRSGIEVHVFNEFAHGAVGELPFTHTWPEVWIENDRDEQQAVKIIAERTARQQLIGELDCPDCGQQNPANFEICWNCSTDLGADD